MSTAAKVEGHNRPLRLKLSGWSLLIWPTLAICLGLITPLFLLLRTSMAQKNPAEYSGSGFTLDTYAQLLQPLIINSVTFSAGLAVAVASISTIIAFSSAYVIAQLSQRAQTAWLIGILSTLALSEVLVTFAWQILMSRRAGISNIGVWLGLIPEPVSLAPSLGAVVACVVYYVFPFSFMTLYPGVSRLDPSLMEAARTMGSHPVAAFFRVIVPNMRKPLVAAFVITCILTLGAFVPSLVLGGPSNWTIGVVISEVALSGQNLPLAAAISVLLMGVAVGLVVGVGRLAAGRGAA